MGNPHQNWWYLAHTGSARGSDAPSRIVVSVGVAATALGMKSLCVVARFKEFYVHVYAHNCVCVLVRCGTATKQTNFYLHKWRLV